MFETVPTGSPLLLRVGAIALLAGALWTIGGGPAAVLAAVVGIAWVGWTWVRTPYAVAAGQFTYAVWVAETGVLGVLGVVSFGLLFVPDLLEQWPLKVAALAAAVLLTATAAFAGSLLVNSTVLAASVSCIGLAVAAYGVHRYELVRFGLVRSGP